MITTAANAAILNIAGRGAFVDELEGAPALVEDETITAQTPSWFVVAESVISCVFTCVGRMTQ
jgi:hypothetical protein